MKYNYPDGDEDSKGFSRKYKFGSEIEGREILGNERETILIAYDYIDIDETDYCFDQPCLDGDDAFNYFSALKEFSQLTTKQLTNDLSHRSHFHVYSNPNPTLISLVEKISKEKFTPETLPLIGQFALYTDKEQASRKSGVKSPRIYFIIGKNAVMHILFYDPFHEINPKKPE